MTLEINSPQLSKTDHFIKKICKIIFFTHFWTCTVPIHLIVSVRAIHSFLSISKSGPLSLLPLFPILGIAIGLAFTVYTYKKIYKQHGYWLLVIWMALVLYAMSVLPFFHTVNLYYKTHLLFLERLHFNSPTLTAISICMQAVNYLFTISCLFLLWVNIKYHIKNRKIKKSRKLEENA